MNSISRHQTTQAENVLSRASITAVWCALGGQAPKHGRAPAFWRDTRDANVAIREDRATWYDHARGEGGGILDLVVHVRGGDRQDALKWLAGFVGVEIEDRLVSASERTAFARERAMFERDLIEALYWRRPVLLTLENELVIEKAKLFDPTQGPPDFDLIREYTRTLDRLRRSSNEWLVREYRDWRAELPRECRALVRWARDRERAELRALLAYLRSSEAA